MNTLRSTIWFRIAYTTVALSAAIGLIVIPPFYTLLRTEASQVQLTPSPFPSPTKTTLPNYTTANSLLYRDASQITLRGINWFGFETSEHTVHGLWKRNWNSMLDQTQQLGFNAVRLPVCMDSLSGAQVRSINYTLNPELVNLSSTAVLDTIIQGMEQRGMYYIIDFHNFDCGEYNELWYTKDHTEEEWITSLTTVAHKYKDNRYFIGIDLKNEPHGAATWGTGAALTDWNLAAERAGKAVL